MSFEYNDYSKFWDFFGGHIYCINLLTRDDRYESSKKFFEKYDIPVEYLRVEKHPKGGEYGVFDSHVKLISKAYYAGAKRALIFEDDIEDTEIMTPENVSNCIQFMKKNEDWDFFYFGFACLSLHQTTEKYPNSIYKVKGYGIHAYVINRWAMSEMLGLNRDMADVPIDDYYLNYNTYGIYPSMIIQRDTGCSDIQDTNQINTSAYSKYRKMCETYNYYVGYPFIYLIIVVLLLILFIYYRRQS